MVFQIVLRANPTSPLKGFDFCPQNFYYCANGLEGKPLRKLLPSELNALGQGKESVRLPRLVESRQVSPASISKPSMPMVTLIINDEFLADFQLSNLAFPVVRSVLACLALVFQTSPAKQMQKN